MAPKILPIIPAPKHAQYKFNHKDTVKKSELINTSIKYCLYPSKEIKYDESCKGLRNWTLLKEMKEYSD